MILSNIEIHRAIDEKRLVITPEPLPRLPTHGVNCPYQTTAVDLKLSDEIAFLERGLPLDINLTQGPFAKLFAPHSKTERLSSNRPYVLEPNRLVLGRTVETVTLPILPNEKRHLPRESKGKVRMHVAVCWFTSLPLPSTLVFPGPLHWN